MRRKNLNQTIGAAAVCISILFAFRQVIGPGMRLAFRDHDIAWRPRWWAIYRAFSEARLPSLTNASPGQIPLEALVSGSYTPLSAVFFLGEFDIIYDLFVIACYLTLGIGAFLFLIDLGAQSISATGGSVVLAISGPILSLENLLPLLLGVIWVPWIAWSFRRLLLSQTPSRWYYSGLLAFFLGFQLQTLLPHVVYLNLGVVAALLYLCRREIVASGLVASGISALLGVGISCLDLFPTLAFLPSTRRSAGLEYFERAHWNLEPIGLVELLVPSFWWSPEAAIYSVQGVSDSNSPLLLSCYLGSTSLCVVAVAIGTVLKRKCVWSGIFLFVFLLGLVCSLGDVTPLHSFVSSLPFLKQSRFPPKYLIWTAFAIAGLTTMALQRLSSSVRELRIGNIVQFGLLLCVYLVISTRAYSEWLVSVTEPRYSFFAMQGVQEQDLPSIAHEAMLSHSSYALLAVGVIALALKALQMGMLKRREWVLAAFICMDLAGAGSATIVGAHAERATLPARIEEEIDSDSHRGLYFLSILGPRAAIAVGDEESSFSSAGFRAKAERGGVTTGSRVYTAGDLDSEGFSSRLSSNGLRLMKRVRPPLTYRIAARLGIGWLSTYRALPNVVSKEAVIPDEAPHYFTPLPDRFRFQRVSVSTMWHEVPNKSAVQVVSEYVALGPAPGLPVLLSRSSTTARSWLGCSFPSETEIESETLERVVVKTKNKSCPTLLRLQQNLVHGWYATVDGYPTELETVDFGVIGVLVPRGEHEIEISYRSVARMWIPTWLASIGLALLTIVYGLLGRTLGQSGEDV